jgi:opacity protein-like surface antigen
MRKSIPITLVALTALCTICTVGTAFDRAIAAEAAEDPTGFSLGLKFLGSSLHTGSDPDAEFLVKDDGGGVQLDFGYRFNPIFMLELSIGGANHETSDPAIDARFESYQILAYYRFSPERAFRPYLKGGLGGYALQIDQGSLSWRVEGGGVALGGGFRYFFNPHFSLGLDITHNTVVYDNAVVAIEGLSYEWEIDDQGSETALGLTFGYSF